MPVRPASPTKIAKARTAGIAEAANTDGRRPLAPTRPAASEHSAPGTTLVAKDDASAAHLPSLAAARRRKETEPGTRKEASAGGPGGSGQTGAGADPAPACRSSHTPTLLGIGAARPGPVTVSPVVNDEKGRRRCRSSRLPRWKRPHRSPPGTRRQAHRRKLREPAPAGDPVQLATTGDDQNKSAPSFGACQRADATTQAPRPPAKSSQRQAEQTPIPLADRTQDGAQTARRPKSDAATAIQPSDFSTGINTGRTRVKSEPPEVGKRPRSKHRHRWLWERCADSQGSAGIPGDSWNARTGREAAGTRQARGRRFSRPHLNRLPPSSKRREPAHDTGIHARACRPRFAATCRCRLTGRRIQAAGSRQQSDRPRWPKTPIAVTEPEPSQSAASSRTSSEAKLRRSRIRASDGWVSVPNSGK